MESKKNMRAYWVRPTQVTTHLADFIAYGQNRRQALESVSDQVDLGVKIKRLPRSIEKDLLAGEISEDQALYRYQKKRHEYLYLLGFVLLIVLLAIAWLNR